MSIAIGVALIALNFLIAVDQFYRLSAYNPDSRQIAAPSPASDMPLQSRFDGRRRVGVRGSVLYRSALYRPVSLLPPLHAVLHGIAAGCPGR